MTASEIEDRFVLLDVYVRIDDVLDERRPGDQLIYVTDCGKIRSDTGWKPEVGITQTLGLLRTFWEENRNFFHRRAVVRPRPFPVATEALGRVG